LDLTFPGPIAHLLLGHDAGVEQTGRRQHTAEGPDQDQDDAHLPTRRAALQRMHNGDVSAGWQEADVPTHRLDDAGGKIRWRRMSWGDLPIETYGHQREDRSGDRHVGHEIVDCAINRSEWPIRIQHEYKVEDAVQR